MNSMVSNPIKGVKRVIDAATALRSVLRDPDDTKQFFRFIDALGSRAPAGFTARFALSRPGARLLAERPDILARLQDRAWLASLPANSLGRAYLAFMQRDGLTPEFLVEASNVTSDAESIPDEADYIGRRMRDTHDLWHVVTGYGGDLLGEAAVLTFTFAQTTNFGIGVFAGIAALMADEPDARRLLLDAFARGLRAAWLPGVEWEKLLAEDLDAVRLQLRVGAAVSYEPFHARDLPPGGLLAKPVAA
jgi:ubiquinone biosynthesis protein COQ4